MSKRRISPNLTETIDFQAELSLLYRRRLALVNLIRSVEEYNLTLALDQVPKNLEPPNQSLRIIYSQAIDIPA